MERIDQGLLKSPLENLPWLCQCYQKQLLENDKIPFRLVFVFYNSIFIIFWWMKCCFEPMLLKGKLAEWGLKQWSKSLFSRRGLYLVECYMHSTQLRYLYGVLRIHDQLPSVSQSCIRQPLTTRSFALVTSPSQLCLVSRLLIARHCLAFFIRKISKTFDIPVLFSIT